MRWAILVAMGLALVACKDAPRQATVGEQADGVFVEQCIDGKASHDFQTTNLADLMRVSVVGEYTHCDPDGTQAETLNDLKFNGSKVTASCGEHINFVLFMQR